MLVNQWGKNVAHFTLTPLSPSCSTRQWRKAVCPTAVVTLRATLKSKYGMALTFPPAPISSACGNPADRDYAALSSSLDNAYT